MIAKPQVITRIFSEETQGTIKVKVNFLSFITLFYKIDFLASNLVKQGNIHLREIGFNN